MMLFNEFVRKHNLKNKATSIIKIQQVLSSLGLNDVGLYLRDGLFTSDIGIVNLHPFRGTHWILYIHEFFYDSHGCAPPKKLSKVI